MNPANLSKVVVVASEPDNQQAAEAIASKLGLSSLPFHEASRSAAIVLTTSVTRGIQLSAPELDAKAVLSISFHDGAASHRRKFGGGKSQLIAKAVGIDGKRRPTIIDATAGLGGDSFVFASLGSQVTVIERSPVLVEMLSDAISRAERISRSDGDIELLETVMRIKLLNRDACEWLGEQNTPPAEVVYLDPMFPERKKNAAVKKDMQILQLLVGQDHSNETELLALALEKASHRVVAKRPRHAPPLEGPPPGYALEGKSTRFDIYPLKSLTKS